jgi:ATP-dependent HslUV protease subunit HslV
LEALMIAVNKDKSLIISGNGDVIEADDNVMAIGSGGSYAQAAARALVRHSTLSATEIAQEAMKIAAEICIYTNDHVTLEEINVDLETQERKNSKDKGKK